MASIWVESLSRSFDQALDMLASGVRDCPDELWETAMWDVAALAADHTFLGADWKPITDPELRGSLARKWMQRRSTPWSVAWHALEGLDYDLTGELRPWSPPPPFSGHPHWRDLPSLPAAWARSEILDYAEYCRQRMRATLAEMTHERAATPLPRAHRYRGQPHAWIISGLVGHTIEHATQIRQFTTAAGVTSGE